MPTDSPTRWPTPIKASPSDDENPDTPAPTLKYAATSPATSFIDVSKDIAAAASDVTTIRPRPFLFSSDPDPSEEPTISTSAAALPSG